MGQTAVRLLRFELEYDFDIGDANCMTTKSNQSGATLARIQSLLKGGKQKRVLRKLDKTQEKRAKSLEKILQQLQIGQHVQNRTLQTWLSAAEFSSIDQIWEQEQAKAAFWRQKPQAVIKYEALIKLADFQHNRSTGYADKNKAQQAKQFELMSQSSYERALEHLAEQVTLDPSLHGWFDRSLDWGDFNLDVDSVPRCSTSRSNFKQGNGVVSKMSIAEVKLQVVQQALDDLKYQVIQRETDAKQSAKLRAVLDSHQAEDDE